MTKVTRRAVTNSYKQPVAADHQTPDTGAARWAKLATPAGPTAGLVKPGEKDAMLT